MGSDIAELTYAREKNTVRGNQALTRIHSKNRNHSHPDSISREMTSIISAFGKDVFCVINSSLHCLSLSKSWEHIIGFPAEEDLGHGLKDRIAPDHLHRVSHYLSASNTSTPPVRFQVKHKDGHWRWCEMQYMEIETNGAEEIYKCLIHDVSDIIAMQAKYEKAKLEAELAIKSRSEFLANMSHELRTPLNAILGFAQMIDSGMYGEIGHPKYIDYIGSIQESGSILLSKINDLLEIATIDSGTISLNESETDIVALIRSAIEFHSHHAFKNQISLHDHLPREPLMANIDRIRILQVVTNLLSNAVKYNKPGGKVNITCELRKDKGINITISDNGGGIPPTHLENILTAFRQDNSFFARSRNCVGLGLALSKEMVKLHQGYIHIESKPAKGTILTIHLPKERTVREHLAKKLGSSKSLPVN
jgi:PAS domain S-box-containing protein